MKVLKKIAKIVLVIILVMIALLLIRLCISQYRKVKAERENEVSKFVTYNLNGEDQTVLIEGKEKNLPILVMVHGGPCFSPPFNEACRGCFPEVTQSYLTVYWDQLGCGKNRKTYVDGTHLPAGIGTQDYVLMLRDLLVHLREDYPNQPVYLFGMSWGSFLTAKIASEYPELVDQVLVYGQFRGNLFQTQDIIKEILKYCTDAEDKAFLENCQSKDKFSYEEAFYIEGLIGRYTDGFIYQGKTGKKQSNSRLIGLVLQYFISPDYSLRDAVGCYTDNADAIDVAKEMMNTDLTETLQNIQVPYTILQGEKDLQTSRYRIEEFMEQNTNDFITLEIVPDCGHIPTTECFSVILKRMQEMKK